MPDITRRLAAILFADITGYTALMQRNEAEALEKLSLFKHTLETKTAEFQGSIVQYYGDGCLVVFDSPFMAVSCAKAMQEVVRDVVPVRIGIHLGDVVFREGNAFGDAVNIASRIESMGVPGAVLLSQSVRGQIKNHPEFQLAPLGSFEFKNVEEPMEVFALSNKGFQVPKREQMGGKFKEKTAETANFDFQKRRWYWVAGISLLIVTGLFLYQKIAGRRAGVPGVEKSIAVLPFKNLSAAEENQYFCDGVMEAILNHLSRIEGLKVISRTSMERYRNTELTITDIARELDVAHILEGSVQRQSGQVRVAVQLIVAGADRQIWSDIFDRELTDIFRIQSEIAETVAGQLKIEISPGAKESFSGQPTTNLKSYDYYLQGREQLVKFNFDRREVFFQNACRSFEKALQLDSFLAPAWADLALAIWIRDYLPYDTPIRSSLDTIRIFCEKALSIDPKLPHAHTILGNYYLRLKDEKRFIVEQQKALSYNENYATAYHNLGAYYADAKVGEYEKGIMMLEKAVQLDPLSTWTSGYYQSLAIAYTNIGGFEEAEKYSRRVRELGDVAGWNSLVHLYLVQGKYAEAEVIANEWKAKSPNALRYLTEIEINYHKNYKKAIEYYKEYEENFPDRLNFRQRFGLAYWLDGQKEKGRALLLQALAEYEKEFEPRDYQRCYDEPGVYATLGDTQKALAILRDKSCPLHVGLDYYILIDPLFQNLWGNAEFQKIVRERQAGKTAILRKIRQTALKN